MGCPANMFRTHMARRQQESHKMSRDYLNDILEEVRPILEANSSAMCILDHRREIVYSNALYERMLRRKKPEIIEDAKPIVTRDGETCGTVIIYHDRSEINRLKRELNRLNRKLRSIQVKYTFDDIIGNSPEFRHTIKIAKSAAKTPASILLRGESGTGKELFAHAIHNSSPRRYDNFVKINCAALSESLLETELFGYCQGAFTGARRSGKTGLFSEANKGTLFLDEIGDVSMKMQTKLLRALQEKEIMPVGATRPVRIDVRLICATHRSLEEMVEQKKFRHDLYYRINVFPLFIPPLRKRLDDIGPILEYLLIKYNDIYDRNVQHIDPEVIRLLKNREWHGNVRELENILSRTLLFMDEKADHLRAADICHVLETDCQPAKYPDQPKQASGDQDAWQLPANLSQAMQATERQCIIRALAQADGNKNKAAHELGIPLRTLYFKCKKLGV